MNSPAEQKLRKALEKQSEANRLRSLSTFGPGVDFCSNDYLGLSRSTQLRRKVQGELEKLSNLPQGSTGSRLISGNSFLAEELEKQLAQFHAAQAGLLFCSGYAANSGLFASVAGLGDTLVMDELVHASSVDGARLSKADRLLFRHNDLDDLAAKLKQAKVSAPGGSVFVGIESIYSMDGDAAPIAEIVKLTEEHGASLIIDEAHSNGITGPHGAGSVCSRQLEERVFARVHTFGKGLGLHGAVVLGSETLRDYLVNFCRPFIFSTALPEDSLVKIRAAYRLLPELDDTRRHLFDLVGHFRSLSRTSVHQWLDSESWIQSLLVPGSGNAVTLAGQLQELGYQVKGIRAPSVPAGKERIRICLHAFNSKQEINGLFEALEELACTAASLQA